MKEQMLGMLITVLSGVMVYVISQWYTEFVIRPIQEYKKLKANVAKVLVLYARYYSNPIGYDEAGDSIEWEKASVEMREMASEIAAFAEIKPFHLFVFPVIPRKKRLMKASRSLIGLSNSFFINKKEEIRHAQYIEQYRDDIKKDMNICKFK